MIRAATCALVAAALGAGAPLQGQQPWLTAETRVVHDDQPRTAAYIDAELGRFLRPDITLAVNAGGSRITADAGAVRGRIADETGYAGLTGTLSLPAARLGLRGSARALVGVPEAAGSAVTLLGRAIARINAGADVAVQLRGERDRYSWTLASLDTLVLVTTLELALDRAGAPGWAGEAVARRETYGDANVVSTAFGWVLVPMTRSVTHSLRAGYAAAWQDAEQSRWVPLLTPGPGDPATAGQFAPYHTPHRAVTHSALLDVALALGPAWLKVDGSIGVRARDDAPVLVAAQTTGTTELHFYRRSFTPYRAGAALVFPADDRTAVTLGAGFNRLAHYRVGTLRLALARSL
ncbi:hypothetical protein BH23GEM9_BH23GEM9_33130 [soil metagenome]